ncbi:MAG: hypothetical protein H6658_02160 [Ardenticatenaceae bacterium]|nr:hypothetical protein [Ardenticatenaceae bacterium]
MKLLTSLYGGYSGAATNFRVSAEGIEEELPYREICKLLWSYFFNNGLYDELRLAGYFTNEATLKSVRNPAGRVVKFYADTIWPGKLPSALPIEAEGNDAIIEPIYDLWKWSNWQEQKQVLVRWTAVFGEAYIRVATNEEASRVFLQLIKPELVSDREFDERGNITYIRTDTPISKREADRIQFLTRTEVWDEETRRVWEHNKGLDAQLDKLGTPINKYNLKETWGIDFAPFVCAKHLSIGHDERGIGAYLLALDKIDEANRQATRLHSMLFRHNQPTWALGANATRGDGRPVAAPRLGGTSDEDGSIVELGGETFVRLPGTATLEALVPQIDYDAALNVLNAHLEELSKDLPELNYYKLLELGELSGRAIRLLLGPAITSGKEVRGNLEAALVKAQKMALTIGQAAGIWSKLGSFDDGDFEHTFAERDIIPVGRSEEAETWKAERDAGLPLFTSLRRSGYTEEQMAEIEEDKQRETAMNQAGMASALLEAQARFDSGQGSNGLERPSPVQANGNGNQPEE